MVWVPAIPRALPATFGVLILATLFVACGRKSNPLGTQVVQFEGYAVSPYGDPTVNPVDGTIAFNHASLLRVSTTPVTGLYIVVSGPYYYQFSDSGTTFWMTDREGLVQRRVLTHPLDSPTWSPDGNSIIYSEGGQVRSIPVSGDSLDESATSSYSFGGSFFGPKWNPGMTKLAMYGTTGWERGIHVWTAGTTDRVRVIEEGIQPDWSPDGASIVYHGYEDQREAVKVADSLSGNMRTLAKGFTWLNAPTFSPDGSKIAFIARAGSNVDLQVWTVGADGTGLAQVTTDGAGASGLSWTPDGSEIIYVHYRYSEYTCSGGNYPAGTLWRVNPITLEKHQLTFNSGVECP